MKNKLLSSYLRRILFLLSVVIFFVFSASASNIKIDKNALLTGIDTSQKTAFINLDISWENSWRTSTAETNYDAAWVFIKYKENNTSEWKHAYISTNFSDYTITNDNGVSASFQSGTTDKKGLGVFIYRKKEGNGNINWDGIKFKWFYGNNGIKNIKNITIQAFAVEMVYVPKGGFSIGSGGAEASAFYTYPSINTPFIVSSESAITVGQTNGNLCYSKHRYAEPFYGIIPAVFPKGYNAFWCMKYEVTQAQYVAFLNTLSRQQQKTRVWTDISGVEVTNRYVMSNTSTMVNRCGIRCDLKIPATDAINFYCDMNGNGIPNEKDDGQYVSCNFLGWSDDAAFCDWTGLRPMTELEYEKACRGTQTPIPNEYAWGNTSIKQTKEMQNAGTENESALNAENNNFISLGPVRAGFFENQKNTREQNAYSYYKISDLTANLFERCITVSNSKGVTFVGSQGDGMLDQAGNATNADWAAVNGNGAGFRGGSFFYGAIFMRVSDREYAGLADWQRYNHYGFRAVRTAEQ